uniref:Decapping nuclease n=1 Tax=Ceratitis capitata TaxID=7213 RepID=W8BSV2_CERCA
MAAKHTDRDVYKILMNLEYKELTNDRHPPAFYLTRPEICALYSAVDPEFITRDVKLKYFKSPKSYPIDLNEGFHQHIFQNRISNYQMLGKVQKFVLETEENVLQPNASANTQTSITGSDRAQDMPKRKVVLSQRGFLSHIMLIPYRLKASEYNNVTFYATRYCGILHIMHMGWDEGRTKNDSYHGKFMDVCLSDDPDLDPITNVPVNDNERVYGIFKSTIKEYDLIYSAEVGGIISDHKIYDVYNMDEINKCRFINTKLLWTSQHTENIFNHSKSLHWWLQAYLAKSNDICVGLKDTDGVIRNEVVVNQVKNIPQQQKWKPHICTRFLRTTLKAVEEVMSEVDCPYTVYEFIYDSFKKCIKYRIYTGKTQYSFLSEKYIKHCKERTAEK